MSLDPTVRTTGVVFTEGTLASEAVQDPAELRTSGVSAGGRLGANVGTVYASDAIYLDGVKFNGAGGFSGTGLAYSGTLLAEPATYNGISYNFGPYNQLNAFKPGATLPIDIGYYSSISFLAAAASGAHTSQTFIATYTDSTSTIASGTVNSWTNAASSGSSVTVMAYRNKNDGTKDNTTVYLYPFTITLDITRQVQSITLPTNPDVKVLAITLVTPAGNGYIPLVSVNSPYPTLSAYALQGQKSLRDSMYNPEN